MVAKQAMSVDDAVSHVLATNPTFAVTQAKIRGVTYKTFANIPGTTRDLLAASYEAQGAGVAEYLVFGTERWTFDEFCIDVRRTAQALQARFGLQKGTRIAIASRNCPEMLILMMAITSAGGIVVFLNAWWTTAELDYALKDSGAKVVFADAERLERLGPLERDLDLMVMGLRQQGSVEDFSQFVAPFQGDVWPDNALETDDDMAIMYSSGTTGHPKGVVQTHRGAMNAVFSWLLQAFAQPLVDPPQPDARPAPRPCALIVTPLFHVTATHPMFLLSIPAGAKVVIMDKWDADLATKLIEREKVTRFLGVPTQSADLIKAANARGATLETLDFLGSGGAKRPPAQVGELAKRFPNAAVATGWGMTETNANGIGLAGEDYAAQPGVAGRLYPPVQEIRFMDDDGQEVAPGDIGEITVKSPCNMRCYLNKPEATAETMQDGWLRTGDLGRIDPDGLITILDRKKNIIIRGGENIACLDVEAALHRHPAVAEACAFAVPDARLGEVVGAAVQIRDDHPVSAEEIQTFLQGDIAHFKVPQYVWIQATPLPRGATDKLDRRGLRAQCLETLPKNT